MTPHESVLFEYKCDVCQANFDKPEIKRQNDFPQDFIIISSEDY
jgi:hypothetical protein